MAEQPEDVVEHDELEPALPTGSEVGHYRVDRLIGRGGMGEVYAATNLKTGRKVALKRILSAAATRDQRRRFMREAKATTAIEHPNVIDVLDVFEDDSGNPVMVMELLNGETLGALRKRAGTLSLEEVATIALPVVSALKSAHDKGIVHRDLKPDNVFLSKSSSGDVAPKVLDFGIAKILDPESLIAETQGGQTNTGSILGTPHYMSMEQAMSEKDIDHRADIWAMGVILFEALAGKRPLEFENLGQMYTKFLQEEPPSLRELCPDLPDDIIEVLDRCTKKNRDERLDDLAPLIEALTPHAGGNIDASVQLTFAPTVEAQSTEGPVSRTLADEGGAKSRTTIYAAATLAIAVGVGAYALATTNESESAPEPGASAPTETAAEPAPAGEPESNAETAASAVETAAATASPSQSVAPREPQPRVRPQTAATPKPTAAATATTTTPAPRPKTGIITDDPYGRSGK